MLTVYTFTTPFTLYSKNLKRLPVLTDFHFQFRSSCTVILRTLMLLIACHIYRVTRDLHKFICFWLLMLCWCGDYSSGDISWQYVKTVLKENTQ
jgi:hypothetical protein